MKATTEPADYGDRTAPSITIHVLNENKRPIGFAAWTTEDEKPKRKPRKKATT